MLAPALTALALGLGLAAGEGARVLSGDGPSLQALLPAAPEAAYRTAERDVSNWRRQAAWQLEPGAVAALAAFLRADRPVVTRCVRLNNYWCIKSARWNGEIGTDDEGHVGFASAERGADAAATLLRRYYLEFGRRSALDIVRRWAPAECQIGAAAPALMATGSIARTARARYLASRRKVRVAGRAAAGPAPTPRVSAVLPRQASAFRVPDVAVGVGEKPLTLSSTLPYRVPAPAPSAQGPRPSAPAIAGPAPGPAPACAGDEQRLRNYAERIVAPLGLGPADDLRLFEPDGTPTDHLAPVMLAMSGFELGTLRASGTLVEGAVERQRARAAASQAMGLP